MSQAALPQSADMHARVFSYRRSPDQDAAEPAHHQVVVVGAGPVGLTTAIELAQSGVSVVLFDDDDRLSTGSRAICFAKRTLEIADRLGIGQRLVDKGVTWNTGRVFLHDAELYEFNLLPEAGHHRPAFINLQQYYVEGFLLERAAQLPNLDIRWKSKVATIDASSQGVRLGIETPDGAYVVDANWVVACDGSRSAVRGLMGLESKGQTFKDRFLIADVRMRAAFPTERWFWFDPPFHPGQSVLLHKQPDDIWRIDFQLGWDADPVAERSPERVRPRVQALLGPDVAFEIVWVSVYTFTCQRMEKFRHGRVLFVGDSAHGVSPFGARGANSGIQDADNLAWKLQLVISGQAPETLLDSYDAERILAADENILNSTRSTDFITPKSKASRALRDATLELARTCAFARRLVNSGRLSVPTTYVGSPLNTADVHAFAGAMVPGAACADANVRVDGQPDWFLRLIGGGFAIVVFCGNEPVPEAVSEACTALAQGSFPVRPLFISLGPAQASIIDEDGHLHARYDGAAGTVYLLRPDQHVAARWRAFDIQHVQAALARAMGQHEDLNNNV